MLAPPQNKAHEGGFEKRDVRISSGNWWKLKVLPVIIILNFSKVFVLLENPEFRNFLIVVYKR